MISLQQRSRNQLRIPGLQLAASFPETNFDCGLGTGSLLAANIAELPIFEGRIEITDVEPEFYGYEVAPVRIAL